MKIQFLTLDVLSEMIFMNFLKKSFVHMKLYLFKSKIYDKVKSFQFQSYQTKALSFQLNLKCSLWSGLIRKCITACR